MNEPLDPIEAELSSLRPREVSPELYRRVARGLAAPSPRKTYRLWRPALVAGLAAACLAAIAFHRGGSGVVGPGPIDRRSVPAVAVDDSRPMLLAYQRALARSPEALGALLDKHAQAAAGPGPGLGQIRGFTRSVAVLDTLLGDD
jgi:hypothetical protein